MKVITADAYTSKIEQLFAQEHRPCATSRPRRERKHCRYISMETLDKESVNTPVGLICPLLNALTASSMIVLTIPTLVVMCRRSHKLFKSV